MKRLNLVLAALFFSIFGFLAPAQASSPHVVKGPDVSVSNNTLTITASIAGLGNVSSATFNLNGTITVSSRCYTKSGNTPQAANKQETIPVDATGTFPVRNGRTNVSFVVTPLSTLKCPGGQHVVIESVSYDLTLTGEGLSIPISG
jgi:hypothetical protein